MEVMSPERWERLQEIYHAALPMNQRARRAFLERACAGDEELRREVESLLAADDRAAEDFLQSSPFTLGMRALAGEETRRTVMISEKQKLDGRYEILGALGAGGMGNVYKARDTRVTHRLVVVKVLKEEWLNNDYVVAKFKQEAVAIAKIDDPGVVGILDAGVSNGQPWLVMQYVEGSDLSQHIEQAPGGPGGPGGMDFAEVAEILKQVGRTLTAAHHAGVIHRDLKPGNIMIRRNNSGDLQVKVIDFGIAKVKDSALGPAAPTQFQVGTPLYMSPEQIRMQEVTPASDVYALGVIAYQMLTGKFPFNPKDRAELPTLQKNGVKVKPSALRAGLSEAAGRAVLRALSYEAGKRQQSAREFGDELARALTPPPEPPPPSSRPIIDKRWLIAGAAVILGAVIAVVWWILSDRNESETKSLPPVVVIKERPSGNNPTPGTSSPGHEINYIAESQFPTGPPLQGMVYATIGFTVWRTRPATARDGEDVARETIDSLEMVSERVADSISDGERIYLGIESLTGEFSSDKGGYLYVINREQYADDSFGRARLIFPTLLTYEGKNRVKPGQPIVLPETNRPFIIRRSSPAQVAETYTIILSPWQFRLPEPLGAKAMVLPDNLVSDWEKQYGGRMYRATLRGGVGQTRTKREQSVGIRATIDTAEPLIQNEPLPQNCFRGAVKIGNPAIATLRLKFKN